MRERVVAIIEARMGSIRLPEKTLMDVAGTSLLERVVARLKLAKSVDEVMVATSTNAADDKIEALCRERGIPVFRGSEDDVLGRVHGAALQSRADLVVQSGADCPFYDPDLVDLLVHTLVWGGYSYAANDMELTFPEGIDAHVILASALAESACHATRSDEREDTPRYIWNNSVRYPIFNLRALPGSYYNRPEIRLTIDYPEDMELCRKIYESFDGRSDFSTRELIELIDCNPAWAKLNAACEQKSAAYVKNGEAC
ncbi:MAG: glycosyltransferase family protein [Sulfuritalea sp.]|nr:glycosyltransferase family protein [Sulfuritalea sp.]